MANKEIPELAPADTLDGTELVHVVQDGNSRKTTTQGVADLHVAPYPPGFILGFRFAYNADDPTNDIDVTAGWARDSSNAVNIICGAMTKQLDVNWAPGTDQGLRNSAVAIANDWYNLYVVAKAAGADPDYYAHTSLDVATVIAALQAEPGGADYAYAALLFSINRASGAIRRFQHVGDDVLWEDPPRSVFESGQTYTTRQLKPMATPLGRSVVAYVNAAYVSQGVTITSPYQNDEGGSASSVATVPQDSVSSTNSFTKHVRTNDSSQIGVVTDGTASTIDLFTIGYRERRGEFS